MEGRKSLIGEKRRADPITGFVH